MPERNATPVEYYGGPLDGMAVPPDAPLVVNLPRWGGHYSRCELSDARGKPMGPHYLWRPHSTPPEAARE